MSLGLTKPGLLAAGMVHPKTGEPIEPIGYLKNGRAVWPVLGAASDDPDDPAYTGEGGSEDDDDEEEDDDEEDQDDDKSKSKSRKSKSSKTKSSRTDEDDDDDDDDDEEDKPTRPERQAARYRTRLREEERKNKELNDRLRALEDKDKKPDEVASRDLTEARETVQKLTDQNRTLTAQLAFFQANVVSWADPADAFALAEREGLFEDVMNDDGTVDTRELRRGLRDLAKRKKYLVKSTEDDPKARGRKSKDTDEDEDEDDEEPRSRRSASTMNGGRKGKRQAGPSREQLAQKFPVLNRM